MNYFDLRRIDLNLLVTFDALMVERSVTRAASRLGLGQPAVSHALARLRELVGDRFFISGKSGLVPTSRALQLAPWIRSVLEQAQTTLLAPSAFNPGNWNGTIRIAMTPTIDMVLMPKLLPKLRRYAPMLQVAVYAVPQWRDIVEGLAHRSLDLYVGVTGKLPPAHRQCTLWNENLLAAFSPRQLRLRTPLSLSNYLAHPHIVAATTEITMESRLDEALARIRRQRRIVMTTPHLLAVPQLMLASPIIATLHSRAAYWLADTFKLKTSRIPLKIDNFTEAMIWHEAVDRDPAQLWLRQIILSVARDQKISAIPR